MGGRGGRIKTARFGVGNSNRPYLFPKKRSLELTVEVPLVWVAFFQLFYWLSIFTPSTNRAGHLVGGGVVGLERILGSKQSFLVHIQSFSRVLKC